MPTVRASLCFQRVPGDVRRSRHDSQLSPTPSPAFSSVTQSLRALPALTPPDPREASGTLWPCQADSRV